MLPAYRNVYLRVFAVGTAEESEAIADGLLHALAGHDSVDVRQLGPYWKIPENLEFVVNLTPRTRVAQCVAALAARAPAGWNEDVWNRPETDEVFLHPAVVWAHVTTMEDRNLPRFRAGDRITIRDTPSARAFDLVGVRAVVEGDGYTAAEADDEPHWAYTVALDGEGQRRFRAADELLDRIEGHAERPDDGLLDINYRTISFGEHELAPG